MTDKKKQIAEMVTVLHQGLKPLRETYDTETIAEILYEAGYRKQVDVLEEGDRCGLCTFYETEHCSNCGAKMAEEKTLEIKSERRDLTFGTGEPAVSHEKAVETVKEYVRLTEIAEMSKVACTSCDYANNGSCDLLVTPGQCSKATCIAEAFYNAGYREQSGWISVDDRLPDKNTMVLGFIHNVYADGSYWDNILVMELNSAGYFVPFNCATIKDNRVTHWMPLPGAPKMKGGL